MSVRPYHNWLAVQLLLTTLLCGAAPPSTIVREECAALVIVDLRADNPDTVDLRKACQKRSAFAAAVSGWSRAKAPCVYRVPASAGDEAAQLQLIQNALAHNAAALAVAPANSAAIWKLLLDHAGRPPLAVIAQTPPAAAPSPAYWPGDRSTVAKAAKNLVTQLRPLVPAGGSLCLQLGGPSAVASSDLAQAFSAAIPVGVDGPIWRQVARCPIYTNGDNGAAERGIATITAAYPDLGAVVLIDDAAAANAGALAAIRRRYPRLAVIAPARPASEGDEQTLFEKLLPANEPSCSPCESAMQDDCIRLRMTRAAKPLIRKPKKNA